MVKLRMTQENDLHFLYTSSISGDDYPVSDGNARTCGGMTGLPPKSPNNARTAFLNSPPEPRVQDTVGNTGRGALFIVHLEKEESVCICAN